MVKRGDTLIEVTIAVGIFSLVAIAIASVMSGGMSGAQTSLETTLTREQIDTQAEALRFIHAGAVAGDGEYKKLWDNITANATNGIPNWSTSEGESEYPFLQYAPESCAGLYDKNSWDYMARSDGSNSIKPFVINTAKLGGEDSLIEAVGSDGNLKTDIFAQSPTYPHLANDGASQKVFGLYVFAVKGGCSKKGSTPDADCPNEHTSFYDFYIRSCWYGIDAKQPSTISTVIRLHDPPKETITSTTTEPGSGTDPAEPTSGS